MLAAMRWLVYGCRRGDSLVFLYSGHGSQLVDTSNDELDGYDETLCPLDYKTNGMISDDEVHATIVQPLPVGVQLHAFIDACHSGSSLDLPYVCKLNRNGSWQWETYSRVHKKTSGGLAICFSGCDDNQTSSDTSAFTGDTITGAMTFCFIRAVESAPDITYGCMLHGMRMAIREANTGTGIGYPIACVLRKVFRTGLVQEPQLSSSDMFDIYQRSFIL
uniref:Metacaspase-1 n=1 Tax=Anthurium amnicola TaxID=1678845 RepID=A0A1D1Z1Z6_9ARAE